MISRYCSSSRMLQLTSWKAATTGIRSGDKTLSEVEIDMDMALFETFGHALGVEDMNGNLLMAGYLGYIMYLYLRRCDN